MKLMFASKKIGFSDLRFVLFFSVEPSDTYAQFSSHSLSVHLQILIAWERHKLPASSPGIYAANLISV